MIARTRKRVLLMALIISLAAMLVSTAAFAKISVSIGTSFERHHRGTSVVIGIGPDYGYRYWSSPKVYIYRPYYDRHYPGYYYDRHYDYRYYWNYERPYPDGRGPWSYPRY